MLATRGDYAYFLHCPKSNKNASDPKNSPIHSSNSLVSWFAFSLCRFSLAPISVFMARNRPSGQLGQFWVTDGYLFEMIFFKTIFHSSYSFGSQSVPIRDDFL